MATPTLKNNITRRLPAEWEAQSAILMAWPNESAYWKPLITAAEHRFSQLIYHIAEDELVVLVTSNKTRAMDYLKNANVNLDNIRCYEMPTNDVWARDFGPITILENNVPTILNFQFNAWGNKYDFPLDREICTNLEKMGAFNQHPFKKIDWVLEGGSIETDGCGTLLTTKKCLLNTNRNANYSAQVLEDALKRELGFQRILWLSHGFLPGDDTDAHIDTLARFCDANTICYQSGRDADLEAMAHELKQFKTIDGAPYRLVALPATEPKHSQLTGDLLPSSYANFLITNHKVIVPTYQDAADDIALDLISSLFPNRQVIGVDSLTFIENFGSIHCLTMQIPAGIIS